MFRLHRSDGLVLAVIVLTAGLGLAFWEGTSRALHTAGLGAAVPAVLLEGPAPSPGAGPAVPVEIRSPSSGFSIVGLYPGWMALENDELVFRTSSATIRARKTVARGDSDPTPILVGIRLGLATETGSSWKTLREGPLLPVRHPLQAGRVYGLRNLELRIEGVHSWDLQNAWPVLIHELLLPAAEPGGPEVQAWTHAHGPRESLVILRRLAEGKTGPGR